MKWRPCPVGLAGVMAGLQLLWLFVPRGYCNPIISAATSKNMTIVVPAGTTNHSDARIVCTPSTWKSNAAFFLGNYVAHAATVKSCPGQTTLATVYLTISALLFPASGILQAMRAIVQHTITRDSPLEAACRAGALCVVIRMNHAGALSSSHKRTYTFKPALSKWSLRGLKVHGICRLPEGYGLAILPANTRIIRHRDNNNAESSAHALPSNGEAIGGPSVQRLRQKSPIPKPSHEPDPARYHLSCTYSLVKGLVAIFQTIYASYTLYEVRGDQLEQYGFAAFGLTVIPYLVMSLMNLLAALLSADYSTMFLVKSSVMDAATRDGGKFDGVVASIADREPSGPELCRRRNEDRSDADLAWPESYGLANHIEEIITHYSYSLFVACLSFIPYGVISGFRTGQSSAAQRGWTMSWLALGIFIMPVALTVPAIGGFVVVGQMLNDYGKCVRLW